MEEKINIAEILKDKKEGMRLYSPIFGECAFCCVREDTNDICVKKQNGVKEFFDSKGLYYNTGEVMLFPSKEMRDWSKFFKKGDVLVHRNGDVHVIFEVFSDNRYTRFKGKHYLWKERFEDYNKEVSEMITFTFRKASDDEAKTYINTLEKHFGGKLNLETLEIEKPEKPAFEIGKLYVFNEEDEDGELTIIGELIDKNESEDTLRFGNQYEIENEKFVTDQTFDLRISVNKELREATELEVEIFNKHFAIWKKEKEAKEQPAFKPFDKVLVRTGRGFNWYPALFVRDRGENSEKRYIALPIHIGTAADFSSCIAFEGHENIAFTSYDIEDLPF